LSCYYTNWCTSLHDLRPHHLEATPGVDAGRSNTRSTARRNVPLNGFLQPFLKRDPGSEPKLPFCPRGIQLPAGLAIRLGGIPCDLSFETREAGDEPDEVPEGDLEAQANINRLLALIPLRRQNDSFLRISHVKKLPCSRPRPPNHHPCLAFALWFPETSG